METLPESFPEQVSGTTSLEVHRVDTDYNCLPDVSFGLDSYLFAVLQGSSGVLLPSQLGLRLRILYHRISMIHYLGT